MNYITGFKESLPLLHIILLFSLLTKSYIWSYYQGDISQTEVDNVLTKERKSVGIDGILSELLKNNFSSIVIIYIQSMFYAF